LIEAGGIAGGGPRWRLIVDEPADGAWNMAVDEAILESYERASRPEAPTLRLYGWRPAALSLGRSQSSAGACDARALADDGVEIVRRPTGGGAVLHEFERTYAVVGALGPAPFGGGVIATYRVVAQALVLSLARLGVTAAAVEPRGAPERGSTGACFERTGAWEIEVRGRKLVGCAQARRRGAFLQHGSIPRRLDPQRLSRMVGAPVDGSRFIDLERAAAAPVSDDAIDGALIAGFEESFGAALVRGSLTESEALRAAELRCWKYDSIAWTRGGAIGTREARWGPVAPR